MKKLVLALALAITASLPAFAAESFLFGAWFDCPKGNAAKNVDGIALGVPVVGCSDMNGASVALCGNKSAKTDGIQFAIIGFNNAKSLSGVQLSFVNLAGGQHGDCTVQVGAYNQSAKNGVQVGFVNYGCDNATVQVGLLNINHNGLFPVMIFVNFKKDFFNCKSDAPAAPAATATAPAAK